jgi:hypothetical protein
MAPATFDGVNLLITLPAPTGGFLTVDVQQDIYSDWKVWVKDAGGHQFEPAFDTTGGDPIPGGQFISGTYFLRNDLGWRIQTTDTDQEVTLLGNLYPRDENFDTFVPRPTRTVSFGINLTANPRDLSSDDVTAIRKRMLNREYTNPVTNKLEQYDDADVAIERSADIFKDDGVTPWDGTGPIRRRDKMT